MKIVLTCDQLLEMSRANEVFELLCEMYGEAEVYTLAHLPNAFGTPIEARKIHSTFLSHKTKSYNDFQNMGFAIPTAASKLFIPCSVDLIINVSTGFSQGIKKCEKTKQVTYLFDERGAPKTWKERFFGSYLDNWSRSKLAQCDELWVATDSLRQKYDGLVGKIKVVEPGFKIDQFPLHPQVEKGPSDQFKMDYFAVNAENLNPDGAKRLMQIFQKNQAPYYFVGADNHLEQLKEGRGDPHFLGVKKPIELSPILSGAKGVVDFQQSNREQTNFPKLALWGLASGRPVIMNESLRNHDFFPGEGVHFANTIDEIETAVSSFSGTEVPQKLRGMAMKYNAIKFKSSFKRKIEKFTSGES